MNRNMRTMRLALAASALTAGALAGAAALAHPEHDGEGVRKEIIVVNEVDGAKDGKDGEVRRFHIERDGKGKSDVRIIQMRHDGKGPAPVISLDGQTLRNCDGGDRLVDETAGDDKHKTKVIICGKGDPAARAQHLEQALARIQSNEHISAEHKEKIAASLRDAIDRARSTR